MTMPQRSVILIAEDNSDWRSTVSDFLQAKGYCVTTACDGLEAVAKADAEPPQLILMDIDMPRMGGLDATRRIRSLPHLKGTPIVVLSAMADSSDREACIEAGANRFLAKPYSLNGLAEVVAWELGMELKPAELRPAAESRAENLQRH